MAREAGEAPAGLPGTALACRTNPNARECQTVIVEADLQPFDGSRRGSARGRDCSQSSPSATMQDVPFA